MSKRTEWDAFLTPIICMIVVAIIVVAALAKDAEVNDWPKYKATHHCKADGREEEGRKAWECDDGVTYWRHD